MSLNKCLLLIGCAQGTYDRLLVHHNFTDFLSAQSIYFKIKLVFLFIYFSFNRCGFEWRIRKLAGQLVDPVRPGDFNQALMELGATVCTPLNPSCSSCPASDFCHALSNAKHDSTVAVTDYPVKGVKVKQRSDFSAVCVVEILGAETLPDKNESSSKFVLVKRPDEGLLAGLWEFPSVSLDGAAVPLARREATDRFLKKNLKIDIKKTCNIVLREDIGEFVHIFSHIRLKLYIELLVLQLKGASLFLFDINLLTFVILNIYNILSLLNNK